LAADRAVCQYARRVRRQAQAYSSATMASAGHTSAQLPQSVQASGSITYMLSPSLMASTGHSLAQTPQDTQSSVILCGIRKSPLTGLSGAEVAGGRSRDASAAAGCGGMPQPGDHEKTGLAAGSGGSFAYTLNIQHIDGTVKVIRPEARAGTGARWGPGAAVKKSEDFV